MPTTLKTIPGDTFAKLASEHFSDGLKAFKIVEFNNFEPSVIFDEIPEGIQLDLPSPLELIEPARPVLQRVSETITDVETAISQISGMLPPQLAGYTDESLRVLGDINGAIGDVETTIMEVLNEIPGAARAVLGDETYRVVEWLLHRSREGFTVGEAVKYATDELGIKKPKAVEKLL